MTNKLQTYTQKNTSLIKNLEELSLKTQQAQSQIITQAETLDHEIIAVEGTINKLKDLQDQIEYHVDLADEIMKQITELSKLTKELKND